MTATFALTDAPPVALLKAWIDESYRAQAPKKLVAQLDTSRDEPPKRRAKRQIQKRARCPM